MLLYVCACVSLIQPLQKSMNDFRRDRGMDFEGAEVSEGVLMGCRLRMLYID